MDRTLHTPLGYISAVAAAISRSPNRRYHIASVVLKALMCVGGGPRRKIRLSARPANVLLCLPVCLYRSGALISARADCAHNNANVAPALRIYAGVCYNDCTFLFESTKVTFLERFSI